MRKINMIKTVSAVTFASSLLLASCTGNFEDLNTHPTDVYDDQMTEIEKVGSVFPVMTYLLNPQQENNSQMTEQMVGSQYGGYFTCTNKWNGTNFSSFNPQLNWVDTPFKDLFTDFYPNFLKVKDQTGGVGTIYAWASIIRVGVMLRVADTYGPIPYSQMGQGEFAVAYDDVKDLYHNMITDLTKSIEVLSGVSGTSTAYADYDVMYQGDFSKWVKYANSLKLRMAVRIAAVDTEYAKQVMAEAIQSGVIESNSDNAYLKTSNNPFRLASQDWGDLAVNATISAYMNGYNDPRIGKYMTESKQNYCGARMGNNSDNFKNNYGQPGVYGSSANYSKPAFERNSSMPVFYAAETYFLKAEAALQGWIDGGEAAAKGYYEQGIQTSMEQYGVSAGNYLSSTTKPAGFTDAINASDSYTFATEAASVAWEDGDNKLQKIITQKWIANYPIGFEAWNDFRRTGYPEMVPPKNNLSSAGYIGDIIDGRMVRRLPYPSTEKDSNSANLEAAISMLGGPDTGNTDLWWAKKN